MFKRIYIFFCTYLAAVVYSQSLFFLWFLQSGFSFQKIFIYFLFMYLGMILPPLVLGRWRMGSREALLLGVATSALAVVLANFIHIELVLYLIGAVFGLNLLFFWVVYNCLHFKYSSGDEHGFKSGAYYLIGPLLAVFLSPLSGIIVAKFGFPFLFATSMVLYIVPFILVFFLPEMELGFQTGEALSLTEHPWLIFFQGYLFMLTFNVIPIFTLFFIVEPFSLGKFFGFLSVFAVLAALVNARWSDKLKERFAFFYGFNILYVLSFIPLVLSKSFVGWQIFSGVNNFLFSLANPFNLAFALDHAKRDLPDTMLGREMILCFGKIFLVLVILSAFYFTGSWPAAFTVAGLLSLLYPILAYRGRVYIK